MAKVTTGTGDDGYTGLLGAERVLKFSPRPEVLGTVDEASSALGLARATSQHPRVAKVIYRLQQDLYLLMGELATPPENYERMNLQIKTSDVQRLEALEAEFQKEVTIGNKFIIPGASTDGAALDLARTIVRRAERQVAKLLHEGEIQNREVLRFLNRLSDLLFIIARFVEKDLTSDEP